MSQDPEVFGRRKLHAQRATLGIRGVLSLGHIVGPEMRRCSYGDFALRRSNGIEKKYENRNPPDSVEAGDKEPDAN